MSSSKLISPHGMCFQGTFCVSMNQPGLSHISPIGSQILIEWSVPDKLSPEYVPLGHFTCSCRCGTNGLFIKHRVTSFICLSLAPSFQFFLTASRTDTRSPQCCLLPLFFAPERKPHIFYLDILFQSISSRLWGKNLEKHSCVTR